MVMSRKSVLICGGSGLLGSYVTKAFEENYTVHSLSRSSSPLSCDFTDTGAVQHVIERLKPDIVIHLIALTSIEACEQDTQKARAINATTVQNIVRNIPPETHFTYISTDQVYPDTAGPHAETHTAPVNIYGTTKLEGEEAALQHAKTLVLRTNLFGPSQISKRSSLSDFFINSFNAGEKIAMFDDVIFSPLHMDTLANLVKECIEKNILGVYNLGSRNGMSKAEFGYKIAAHLGLDASQAQVKQSGVIKTRIQRPKDLRMSTIKIEEAIGHAMPALEEEIKKL